MNASYTIIFAATLVSSVCRQASTCFCIGPKFLCIRSTPTEIQQGEWAQEGKEHTGEIPLRFLPAGDVRLHARDNRQIGILDGIRNDVSARVRRLCLDNVLIEDASLITEAHPEFVMIET